MNLQQVKEIITWADLAATVFLFGMGCWKIFELTQKACDWAKKKIDGDKNGTV